MGFIAGAIIAGAGLVGAYESNQQAGKALDAQKQTEAQQMQLANQQNQRASQLYSRYMNTFAPAQNAFIKDAETPIDANVVAGQAAGDVQQASANQQAQGQRYDARYGINPYSGAAQALKGQEQIQTTAAAAGAATGARRYAQDETFKRLGVVANMGNNLLSATGAFTGQAQAGLSQVGAYQGNTANMYGNMAGQYGQMAGYGLSMATQPQLPNTGTPGTTDPTTYQPLNIGYNLAQPVNYTPTQMPTASFGMVPPPTPPTG